MKWLCIPAAAALSLAVTTGAWATSDPIFATDSGQKITQYSLRLAQNDQRNTDKKERKGGPRAQKGQTRGAPSGQQIQRQQPQEKRTIRTNQQQQKQIQRQQSQQKRTIRTNQQQQQQIQRQQLQQKRTIRTNQQQQQKIQRQQLQQKRTIRTNQQQQQQIQRQQLQQKRTIRTNQQQQQKIQRQQVQRPQRYNWGSYQPGRRPPEWNRHRNFDRNAWQQNQRAERRYHWNRYQRPQGWYYRRWTFGMILPSLFWGRQYWIDSYWSYGLMNPPYGYVWVRYGDDAMLVNVETGNILRVEYGLFY